MTIDSVLTLDRLLVEHAIYYRPYVRISDTKELRKADSAQAASLKIQITQLRAKQLNGTAAPDNTARITRLRTQLRGLKHEARTLN